MKYPCTRPPIGMLISMDIPCVHQEKVVKT
jgi:hypothetical protein